MRYNLRATIENNKYAQRALVQKRNYAYKARTSAENSKTIIISIIYLLPLITHRNQQKTVIKRAKTFLVGCRATELTRS